MKIKFLIGYPPKFAVTTWKEIIAHSKDYPAYDVEFYQMIKALEHNEDFEKEILKSRKRLKIPDEGYNWLEYEKKSDYKRDDLTEEEIQKQLELIRGIPNETLRIMRLLSLDKRSAEQLRNIIKTSSVHETDYLSPIHYWLEPDDAYDFMDEDERDEAQDRDKSVNIAFTRQVSKNELIKFIEENWQYIENRVKQLPKKASTYISDRDLRIVELRDKNKLTFNQIAIQILQEFEIDDPNGKVNEDSVKTAYARAKLKISLLAGKRNK